MKVEIIFGLLMILVLLISGCDSIVVHDVVVYDDDDGLIVKARCEDKVVCYRNRLGVNSGVSCFRDEDLVTKYCP